VLFAAVCFLMAIVVGCYALEAVVRIVSPPMPFDGVRDGVRYTWGHPVRLNRAAFREREFVVPKPEGMFRIVVLGDSLTWGAGLAEEERYSNRLEARLREAFPGRSIEALNFGLEGASTTVLRDWWRTISPDVEADLLIVGFCTNDPQPRGQDDCSERERFSWLLRSIESLKSIGLRNVADRGKTTAERMLSAFGLMPLWPEAMDRTYRKDSPEWASFEQALRDIRDIAAARGMPPPILALLNQGVSTTEPTDYRHPSGLLTYFLRWNEQVRATAGAIGLEVVSFEDLFAERLSGQVLAVNYYDGHPSAACNAIYAERLAELVEPIIRGELTASRPAK
jgi:lysophospholipase L1-like esterase